MKKILLFSSFVVLFTSVFSQSLLNKVKNKANQELKKIENKNTPSTSQSTKNKLSANVTRTVALTLMAGENFNYQESCIDLGATINQISFIVSNGSQCFSYKNGTRTPVACPTNTSGCQTPLQCSYGKLREVDQSSDEIKKYIVDKTSSLKTPTMTDEQLKQMSAYMTKEQMDEVKKAMKQASGQSISMVESRTINFNGKKYGPYKMINPFYLTADGKHFYAVISESDAQPNYKVITSASPATISTGSMMPPLSVFAAPDNSDFAIYTMTPETQTYKVITSLAKLYKISEPGWFHGAWFTASGNHVVTYEKETLSIDGNVVRTFEPNTSYEACDLFVSSDGKGVALIKDNNISFPDGDYFQYPLKMALVHNAGLTYFKWLALEDRQVVVYQKPF